MPAASMRELIFLLGSSDFSVG